MAGRWGDIADPFTNDAGDALTGFEDEVTGLLDPEKIEAWPDGRLKEIMRERLAEQVTYCIGSKPPAWLLEQWEPKPPRKPRKRKAAATTE